MKAGLSEKIVSKQFTEKEKKKVDGVVRAAAMLFDRNGYIETSLKDISAAAGLSKGGIYHYFSSKHEILFYIFDTYLDDLLGNVKEEVTNISDPEEKIRYLVKRHLRLYSSRVSEGRALLNHARVLPPEQLKQITRKQKEYANILTDILSQMTKKKGDAKKLTAVSYFIFGMYNSIMYWHDPRGPISLEEIGDICFKLLMDGWKTLSASEVIRTR